MAQRTENRNFENTFGEYDGRRHLIGSDGKIAEPFHSELKEQVKKLLKRCEDGIKHDYDERDYSVYTGTTGMAVLYLHLASTICEDDSSRQHYLHKALHMVEHSLHTLKGKRLTFCCGDAGVLAVSSVLYSMLGDVEKSENCLSQLLGLSDQVCHDSSLPNEVLYGRAGYLYALLYVQSHLGKEKINISVVDKVCQTILAAGQQLSRQEHSHSPLMYTWHEKHYVGAAHGLIGIIYMLLQASSSPSVQSELKSIQDCVDFLLSKQFSSGNFPSSLENHQDKLIHWCHGAPGAIHLMAKSYKVFKEARYLNAAVKCGEVIWERGLLRKGYGICHGVAGNAYAFLCLYKLTNMQKYLYQAMKFAEWCFQYGKHGSRTPDRPFSLFEGMAGTVYFMADLLKPGSALFPAFELKELMHLY